MSPKIKETSYDDGCVAVMFCGLYTAHHMVPRTNDIWVYRMSSQATLFNVGTPSFTQQEKLMDAQAIFVVEIVDGLVSAVRSEKEIIKKKCKTPVGPAFDRSNTCMCKATVQISLQLK